MTGPHPWTGQHHPSHPLSATSDVERGQTEDLQCGLAGFDQQARNVNADGRKQRLVPRR
ncbi:MAG: hypothetical protein QOH82_1676 [Mycobacterium sp.]|jgi:hypothetical protein|nr:hypothetical protein [Mycobacterium sp.]